MRLLTHNILMWQVLFLNFRWKKIFNHFFQSNRPECKNGFPLKIILDDKAQEAVKYVDAKFSPEQVKMVLGKLDWNILVQTASQLGLDLPPSYSERDKDDEIFLNAVHEAVIKVSFL